MARPSSATIRSTTASTKAQAPRQRTAGQPRTSRAAPAAAPARAAAPAPAPTPAPAPAPAPYHLTAAREAALLQEAESLGDNLVVFPGKLARRVAWASRIQLAAERDAADLVRTPFPDGEPPITVDEIHALRDKIELLRATQSRWQATQQTQKKAAASFEAPAAEAAQHRLTLLRFFDLFFRNNPEGQKRLSAIRDGKGDADLVQEVSDLLVLAGQHEDALSRAPRGEAEALRRLRELSPQLLRLLADKSLSPEAQRARKLRDAAYTLVIHTERRLRAAADYWYGGTDKAKDYAPFPATASSSTDDSANDEHDGQPEPPATPPADPNKPAPAATA